MTTNDHTVPQMYLRRFARKGSGKGHMISVASVSDAAKPFTANVRNVASVGGFYWGERPEGVPDHTLEQLLGRIESAAAPVFNMLLDDHDHALPKSWPLEEGKRTRMAWWMAAQILRTSRQRKRLGSLVGRSESSPPKNVRSFAKNNDHIDFIVQHLGVLAQVLFARPWALGFSDACLITSDVPVLILNGQDDQDQLVVAAFWDIVLPLDPHRILLVPCLTDEQDQAKFEDHRFKMDGGMGVFVNSAVYDAADQHIFFHPDHAPLWSALNEGSRLGTPWTGDQREPSTRYILNYPPLDPEFTVAKRWTVEHPPRKRS